MYFRTVLSQKGFHGLIHYKSHTILMPTFSVPPSHLFNFHRTLGQKVKAVPFVGKGKNQFRIFEKWSDDSGNDTINRWYFWQFSDLLKNSWWPQQFRWRIWSRTTKLCSPHFLRRESQNQILQLHRNIRNKYIKRLKLPSCYLFAQKFNVVLQLEVLLLDEISSTHDDCLHSAINRSIPHQNRGSQSLGHYLRQHNRWINKKQTG